MFASLVVCLVFHFGVDTPDHVGNVLPGVWRMPFVGTAVAIAVADGIGTLLAARFALRSRVIG